MEPARCHSIDFIRRLAPREPGREIVDHRYSHPQPRFTGGRSQMRQQDDIPQPPQGGRHTRLPFIDVEARPGDPIMRQGVNEGRFIHTAPREVLIR